MAERSVRLDVRAIVATWPGDAPHGAVARFCAQNGVSRSWFYEVRRRAEEEGPIAAATRRSSRPHRSPKQTPAEIEELVVLARKQLGEDGWDNGPLSVRSWLLERGLPAPSRATLATIFTRRGLVVPQPQKRPHSSYRRFSFPLANDCWQLDGTEWALADGTKVHVLEVLDDCTRELLASRACVSENVEDAIAVVETAMSWYGIPRMLLSDNGTAFNPSRRGWLGKLVAMLVRLGVKPVSSTPRRPRTCGKKERANSTLKRWLRSRPRAAAIPELQTQLDEYRRGYNQIRPHQALGGRTPEHAWNQATVAAAPDPPTTASRSASPRTETAVHAHTVASNGTVNAGGARINLGSEHARRQVIAVINGRKINIFDAAGEHLRTVTTTPGRRFYGNGRPRGGDRKKPGWQPRHQQRQ